METVNNMASAAAKAVWGESKQNGQEPISGQTGDTSKGEPYDAGNIEDPKKQAAKAETNGETNRTTEHTDSAQFAKNTGTAAESEETPDNPSTDLKSKSTPKDSSKAQNDVRDPEDPKTNPKSAPTDVNDAEDGPNEAQKLDGPGPKPIDEVAREHGGDAGKTSEGGSSENKDEGAADEEDEDGPDAKSKGEGTGEQYVKSSGLQADGGDFDATKPGAGREADRLLEEKGIHPGANGPSTGADAEEDESGHGGDKKDKEKKSIGQKIKDKLHRH
ncbi:uncharacterized protein F4822DRAFT_370107 [Hypoxylon trugodes]|uniref:uncharacterized protein n=1 Tax=Hypoxylon trugodes TaxID=326681 RepID=UPI00218E246F|nr:uncharacterized protein F4822DRAFT_370107 [Hypoxylon trugodes]KAI1384680.1 hypothetical protein F4822DRAFT_370107 [Hypoxylon trugodes]